jgi:hypothetical protein
MAEQMAERMEGASMRTKSWRKRIVVAGLTGAALMLSTGVPAQAGTARAEWVCQVPQEDGSTIEVVFVSAAGAAWDGIRQANSTAGQTFASRFGEECTVRRAA